MAAIGPKTFSKPEQRTRATPKNVRIAIMLDKAKTLTGYSMHSLDGEIGKVKDLYFDDRDWTIRYLVADTGEWLVSRQVLISPHSLAGVDRDQEIHHRQTDQGSDRTQSRH